MYIREMGTVELLTREGEIAIAKRIEEGLNQVRSSLAAFPMSIELLLEEYEQHLEGKKRLNEVVLGFIDPNAEEEALAAAAAAAEAVLNEAEDSDDDDAEAGDDEEDRKRGVEGKSVSVRVDLGGRRLLKEKKRMSQNKKKTE